MSKALYKISTLLHQAKSSSFALKKLNFFMRMGVPFNRPHRIVIRQVEDHSINCSIPYIKRNFNHLNGIHACAMATVGEYCAGLCLLLSFKPELYRLIMKKIEVEYHFQGRQNLQSRCKINPKDFDELSIQLEQSDSSLQNMTTEIHDDDNNHVATVLTIWQVKPWSKVRLSSS